MKRFLLFEYGYHEAQGGLYDLTGEYDSRDEAERQRMTQPRDGYYHIADTQERTIYDPTTGPTKF